MKALFARLREPSTMAGLSALLMLFGVPAGVPELVSQVAVGVTGLAAVLMPEAKQ
jgi:hypothetical protein